MVAGTVILAVPLSPSAVRQWRVRPCRLRRMHCGSELNHGFQRWQSWSAATHQRPLSVAAPRYHASAPASPVTLPSRA